MTRSIALHDSLPLTASKKATKVYAAAVINIKDYAK
jgi:hypothetical protein